MGEMNRKRMEMEMKEMETKEQMKKLTEMKMAATNEGNQCKQSPIVMMAMRVSIVLTVRSTMPQLAVSLSLFVRASLYYLFCNICAECAYGEIEIELIVYFSLFRFFFWGQKKKKKKKKK